MKIILFPKRKPNPAREGRKAEKSQMISCNSKCEKEALKKIRRFNKKRAAGRQGL